MMKKRDISRLFLEKAYLFPYLKVFGFEMKTLSNVKILLF